MTTIFGGYYADASRMFIIGKTSPEKEQLVRVAKECLEIGAEAAKPYSFVGDIGHGILGDTKTDVVVAPVRVFIFIKVFRDSVPRYSGGDAEQV